MKTAAAYFIILAVMPFIQAAATLIGSPLFFFLKRIDNDFLYITQGIIVAGLGTFCCVACGHLLFGWFGMSFTIVPILIMAVATLAHDIGRVLRMRGSRRSVMETGYSIGGVLGYVLGAMFFVYGRSGTLVLGIAAIPAMVMVYGLVASRAKSFEFWNLASRHPEEAYAWFENDGCWIIYDPPSGRDIRPDPTNYYGGFPLHVPSLGRQISVYGHIDKIEDSEKRFIASIKGGQ